MPSRYILDTMVSFRDQIRALCMRAIKEAMPDQEFHDKLDKIISDMDAAIASM